ncbi:MAG: hypothetical protein AB2L24_03625 [Mangrovibacterium sp.]
MFDESGSRQVNKQSTTFQLTTGFRETLYGTEKGQARQMTGAFSEELKYPDALSTCEAKAWLKNCRCG